MFYKIPKLGRQLLALVALVLFAYTFLAPLLALVLFVGSTWALLRNWGAKLLRNPRHGILAWFGPSIIFALGIFTSVTILAAQSFSFVTTIVISGAYMMGLLFLVFIPFPKVGRIQTTNLEIEDIWP